MVNLVQALLVLQEIDADLFTVNRELERLPEERERRQAALDAEQAKIEQIHAASQARQVRVKEMEDTVVVQQQRMRKLEKESLSARDVSVVEACRYEMRGLRRQIDEGEREAFSCVELIEADTTEVAALKDRLAAAQTEFTEYSANVETELGQATARQEDLQSKRDARLSKDIDVNTLALYDRLLLARGGEALAPLDGGVCQACYIQVPPNLSVRLARGKDVIQCSSCDRILYLA
ncbi:MAG: C4-type zinc ribbon domain-containing protein [bacterium]|jgi:hypothetical protein|nr:hypothetical protein [Planctomycetota bacterium]